MSLFPQRVMDLLTPEERDRVNEIVDGWKFNPTCACPACGVRIGMVVSITTKAVCLDLQPREAPMSPAIRANDWRGRLPLVEQRLLDEAEATGLLAAFRQAVEEEKAGTMPGNVEKFLLEFLYNARMDVVPRFVLDEYRDQFQGRVDFYSSQGIFAVTCDGVTRAFFPKSRLVGRGMKRSVPGQMAAQFRSDERMTDWIRGKFGYVPRESTLFREALNQPNRGKFGVLVQ